MSRRGGVKQTRFSPLNCVLFLLLSLHSARTDGNIGCVYDDQLCDTKTEWCFDDFAFGRCVLKVGVTSDDLFRYSFKYDDLEKLKEELEDLKVLGYNWKHSYTQCILQTQLDSIRFGIPFNGDICERVLQQTDPIKELQYEQASALQNEQKIQKARDFTVSSHEGIVKYEPDDDSETSSRLDKNDFYKMQPDYESELINQLRIQANAKPTIYKKSRESTSSRYRGTPLYVPIRNRNKFKTNENEIPDTRDGFEEDERSKDWAEAGPQAEEEGGEDEEDERQQQQNISDEILTLQQALDEINREKIKAYTEGGPMFISDKKNGYDDSVYEKILDQYGPNIFGFQRSERLDVKKPGPNYKVNNYAFRNENTKSEKDENRNENEDDEVAKRRVVGGNQYVERYSKESYEYVPNYSSISRALPLRTDNSSYVTIETDKDELQRYTILQFIDRLRQLYNFPPGIFKNIRIDKNRIIFSVGPNIYHYSADDIKQKIEESFSKNLINEIAIKNIFIGQPANEPNLDKDVNRYQIVNANYAYIQLKEPLHDWQEGEKIVRKLEKFLHLPRKTLNNIKTEVYEIAFKVDQRKQKLNASAVAQKIENYKDEIKNELHIDITAAGIGDKDKLPSAIRLSDNESSLYMLTFIVCGVIGAVLVSSATLYYIKKHNRFAEKLLAPREKDLGKDYQELCRGKMSSKSNQDGGSGSGQRITSLSRESDNSPSSRSSTSSWCEEPMTNMDITTGHMVLAYMEDHLTNKARLDTEWAALCAYDADPCSVAIAQLPENSRKNRYVNALPYDHARVILNALSNVNGCDYVNASTITDHDPRNAAYIASQGPLENTICDFWQMIWEQGCVVIVMLTRLVENDTSMCHRYWPLEGSELYNIYEVHLVSEHIWCDDFLVRSFYLKNLKTTETRTVTQFHFLTWPEGGIPSATKPLLEFRRKVNKSFRGRSCPIVVHCSDGVGRTGSYLLLDMVLNRISKGAKEIDIAATLEHIRDQRAGAVCTKQQFQFVLSAVAEEVQAVLRALPQQQPSTQNQGADVVVTAAGPGQADPVATTSGVPTTDSANQTSNQVPEQRKQSK